LNPAIFLVMAALFTWGVGEGMFYIFVPVYLQELGANPLLIGEIFGGFGFVMMMSHIPAGYLADKLGRRPLLITAWMMGSLATWVMALAPSLWPFVAGYLFYGVTAFVSAPLFSYVTAARGTLSAGRAMTSRPPCSISARWSGRSSAAGSATFLGCRKSSWSPHGSSLFQWGSCCS